LPQSNSFWLIGNGKQVNFWTDNWCGEPLSYVYQINEHLVSQLPTKVCDYIQNFQWNIDDNLHNIFPNLRNLASQVTLSASDTPDVIMWEHTPNGELSLVDAYNFKNQHSPKLPWTSQVWNRDIPPTKSFMVWRLMRDKLPTDDKLCHRGFSMPSMCSSML